MSLAQLSACITRNCVHNPRGCRWWSQMSVIELYPWKLVDFLQHSWEHLDPIGWRGLPLQPNKIQVLEPPVTLFGLLVGAVKTVMAILSILTWNLCMLSCLPIAFDMQERLYINTKTTLFCPIFTLCLYWIISQTGRLDSIFWSTLLHSQKMSCTNILASHFQILTRI